MRLVWPRPHTCCVILCKYSSSESIKHNLSDFVRKHPNQTRTLGKLSGTTTQGFTDFILTNSHITSYFFRYLRKRTPIEAKKLQAKVTNWAQCINAVKNKVRILNIKSRIPLIGLKMLFSFGIREALYMEFYFVYRGIFERKKYTNIIKNSTWLYSQATLDTIREITYIYVIMECYRLCPF